VATAAAVARASGPHAGGTPALREPSARPAGAAPASSSHPNGEARATLGSPLSGSAIKYQCYRCVADFLKPSFDVRHLSFREDIWRPKVKTVVAQTPFVELLCSLVKRKSKAEACGLG